MVNGNVVQNYAKDGLIWVSNNSQLSVHNSVFESNGVFVLTSSILILKYNTVLFLSNCKCTNNGAIMGACVLASGNVSIFAKDSIFKGNHAASGGVLYWKNTVDDSGQEHDKEKSDFKIYKPKVNVKNVEKTKLMQGYKSKLVFEKCTMTGHISFEGSVLSADGSPVDIIFNGSKLEGNGGFKDVGSIFVKGKHWSLTTLSIHGCFFESEFSYASGILFGKRAQINIYKSSIIMARFAIISITDYSIVNITRLSIMQSPGVFGYIDIRNSVKFEMTDSQITSMFLTAWVNGFFLYATNNCSARITNSLFGDENQNLIMTNVFGLSNYSSLDVINCTFENSDYSYSRLLTASHNSMASFTNCSILKTTGLDVAHNSELRITNSIIVKSTYSWQIYALIEISDHSRMYIVHSRIINNTLQIQKLISIMSNSSLTISNCLYAENTLDVHILATVGIISIINTRFHNNSVAKNGPGALVVANKTDFRLVRSTFRNNRIYGKRASLMRLSGNTILIQQCVMSKNLMDIGYQAFHVTSFIAIHLSKFVFLEGTKVYNNRLHLYYQSRYQTILEVSSSKILQGSYVHISNCTFGRNDLIYAYFQGITDVFVQHSSFFMPNRDTTEDVGNIYVTGVKSLRFWDSIFYNRHERRTEFYFAYDFSFPKETNFFTLNTNFTLAKTTLETSAVNFLQKAKSKKIINTSFYAKVYHEETSYAAS